MSNTYDVGDVVRISSAFSQNSAPFDPTTVTLKVLFPDATTTTYAGVGLTKDSTGVYHLDLSIALKGTYHYRWFSTGLGEAAEEAWFQARTPKVP